MIYRAEALDVAGVRVVTTADLLALTLRAACDPAWRRSRALRLLRRVLPRDGGDATPGGAAPRHHRQPRGAALLRGRHDGADGRGPGRVPVDRAAALYEPEALSAAGCCPRTGVPPVPWARACPVRARPQSAGRDIPRRRR